MRVKLVILCLLALVLAGNVEAQRKSKKKKKTTWLKRVYHNTTARYNGYFNAKLKINNSIQALKESHQDNYEEILPLFPYIDSKNKNTVSPTMDDVIEKGSMVINIHTISKWLDNAYLQLGEAYFMKDDLDKAQQTFSFILSEFKPGYDIKKKKKKRKKNNRKKKKSKDELTKRGLFSKLKHQYVYHQAIIWLIHTYIEQEEYDKAQAIIDLMWSEEKFPKKLLGELNIMQAHIYLKKDEKEDAITPLLNAIKTIKKKKQKTRPTYILSQLYHRYNKNLEAIEHYEKVLKLKPSYEMEFNTKLNIAKAYEVGSSKSLESIKKELYKLLKDEKNIDYLDQIYYLLAELAIKENNIKQAIEHLKNAVKYSTNNKKQKALSYMKLAEIYFSKQAYRNAKMYFDSTLAALPGNSKDLADIKATNQTLTALVNNFITIEEQDSLLKLAALDEAERNALIDKVIEKKRKELEKAQREKEEENKEVVQNTTSQKNNKNKGWYFYNERAKNLGYFEFVGKWGKRVLEDNWRRKDKNTFANSESTNTGSSIDLENDPRLQRETYLKNLPFKSSQKETAHNKIKNALYKNAIIYKEELNNIDNAIKNFEVLNEKYPKNQYEAESYYYLYLLYTHKPNEAKADFYKNLILKNYPESEFANVINNPNNQESQDKQNEISRFYEVTYNLYLQDNYTACLDRTVVADSLYPENSLSPKFEFIEALSYGKMKEIPKMKVILEYIVKKYPEDETKLEAQRILAYLQNRKINEEQASSDEKLLYFYNPEEEHYYNIVLLGEKADVNKISIQLSNYNKKFHRLDKLQISNIMINKNNPLIIVKGFADSEKTLKYYAGINKNKQLAYLDEKDYNAFTISANNFKTLLKIKELEKYTNFFNKFYL